MIVSALQGDKCVSCTKEFSVTLPAILTYNDGNSKNKTKTNLSVLCNECNVTGSVGITGQLKS